MGAHSSLTEKRPVGEAELCLLFVTHIFVGENKGDSSSQSKRDALQYVEEEKDGNIPLVPCDTLLLCGHLLLLLLLLDQHLLLLLLLRPCYHSAPQVHVPIMNLLRCVIKLF